MTRIIASTAVLIALSAPAFATGYVAPTAPPAVVPVPVADTDWTGFYAGLSYGDLEFTEDGDGDTAPYYSFFIGYMRDFGNIVAGGELEYVDFGDYRGAFEGDEDSEVRLRARLGYDAGRILPYAVVGISLYESTAYVDSEYLFGAGLGVDYQVNDFFRLGLEVYSAGNDEFESGGSTFDNSVNYISIRAAYTF